MIFPEWNILVSGPFHPCNINLLHNFKTLQPPICYPLLTAVFPKAPSSFIYYLYGQLGVLIDEENQPTVFRPTVRHPLPIQFWCAIIVLGSRLTSILVWFRCRNVYINLSFEVSWMHFYLFPSLKPRSFFINSTSLERCHEIRELYGLKIM